MIKPVICRRCFITLVLAFSALLSSTIYAMGQDQQDVANLLSKQKAPDGVVFELIGNEDNYLANALNKVKNYKEQLQRKFPNLDIAVVSHGSEQFNLTRNNQSKEKEAHTQVQLLVDADVPVHVCETHASWRDVTPEDYPDYIIVSPTGPAQIRHYQELGYQLIVID